MSLGGKSAGGQEERPPSHEYALVASNSRIGENVRIGPFSVVGHEGDEPVTIGDDTTLEDHVFVEPGAVIGANCMIEDHCRIGRGSIITDGSRIRSGVRGAGDTGKRHAVPSPQSARDQATSPISPKALVASNAVRGDDVEIGPFAIVGWETEPPVRLGARNQSLAIRVDRT